mgnify:CR=1 FL=1
MTIEMIINQLNFNTSNSISTNITTFLRSISFECIKIYKVIIKTKLTINYTILM